MVHHGGNPKQEGLKVGTEGGNQGGMLFAGVLSGSELVT